jgi:hypothetical protein
VFLLPFLCALLLVPVARAEPTSSEQASTPRQVQLAPHVSYEQQRVDLVLVQQKLTPEPLPSGKRITFIRIVRDDVFVPDEIWPMWWNWFHGRTREEVVRRELLFQSGDQYVEARIEETMRNLRGMGIFTLVRITPVKGENPGEVGILVNTRDLWSLRTETNFSITGKVVNNFAFRLTELNAFGHNKTVSADFTFLIKSYVFGESFYARRVLGSSVAFKERAGLVFHRFDNTREGEIASFSVGQPYYRLAQRFAWSANYVHDNRVYRNTSNGEIRQYPDPDDFAPPYALQVYRGRVDDAYVNAAFRGGEAIKHALTAGWDVRYRKASPTEETGLPVPNEDDGNQAWRRDRLRREFIRDVLPTQRRDSGPTLSYDMFVPRWSTFTNLTTYGLSENVRTGPTLVLATRVPLRAFGSMANALVLSGSAGWIFTPQGYLIDLKVSGVGRLTQGQWIDQKGVFQLRGASPVFWIFRFVMRAYLELRRNDSLRTYVSLGSDTGLRGHLSQEIAALGAHRMLANFELRTLPIMWQAVHLGGVIFYDVGSVFTDFASMRAYYAFGVGLRLMFPQFNRQPFSFDGGMAFDPGFRFVPTITAGQVVPLTVAEDPE